MKIIFILPAIGKKSNNKYIKTWKMEPLTIATLKSLTPKDIDVEFFDDRIELIDYDADCDLVAITVETYTAKRAYEIAGKFRDKGKKTVLGGYHVTLMPYEAKQHSDAVITGNAESVWHKIIADFKKGALDKIYRGTEVRYEAIPDRTIYADKKYLPISLVETGRGCFHKCDFCSITKYYGARYYCRPISGIIRDIRDSGRKYIYLIDDNIVADREFALALFKEMAKLNIQWSSQGSLYFGKDRELLYWMKKSGCNVILIGFESLEEKNLVQMNKKWLVNLGDMSTLVKNIHKAGISVYATFLFGFDHDTADTFKKTIDFSLKHNFYFAAFNHLLPFPGTELYKRLLKEKRIIKDRWWLDGSYKYGDISFVPRNMSPEELSENCRMARHAFFSAKSILKRGVHLLTRKPSPELFAVYWTSNFKMAEEVEEKLNLPVGLNLDELPK